MRCAVVFLTWCDQVIARTSISLPVHMIWHQLTYYSDCVLFFFAVVVFLSWGS